MQNKILIGIFTTLVLGFVLIPALATAETAAEFYKGKTLAIKTASPGGSTDILTRTLVPFFEKELGVTAVVVPSRGNIQQNNKIFSAKPNGLTIGLMDGGALRLPELYEAPGVKYDSTKFEWIASFGHMPYIFQVSPRKAYRSIDDLRKAKNLKFVAATPSGGYESASLFVSSVLGIDGKVTPGLSVGEIFLMLQKGEADATTVTDVATAPQAEKGKTIPLFTISGKSKMEIFAGLPAFEDLVKLTERQKLIEQAIHIYKVIIAPPGTPADRIDFLRKGFARIVKDKKATAAINAVGVLDWGYNSGDEALKALIKQQREAGEIKKELKNYIKKYRATQVF